MKCNNFSCDSTGSTNILKKKNQSLQKYRSLKAYPPSYISY